MFPHRDAKDAVTVKFLPHDNSIAFTVSDRVGPRCKNSDEDVELVQFGYFAAASNVQTKPALRPIFADVEPGAKYVGALDDPLTIAIVAHQRDRGGTQDGVISVASTANERYRVGGGFVTFQVIALTNNLFDLAPLDYPRLDKHPSCPPKLKAAVIRLMKR